MQDAPHDPAKPPGDTVVVHRPDPGIARGVWEAPAWLFLVVAGAVLVGVVVVFVRRVRRWRSK